MNEEIVTVNKSIEDVGAVFMLLGNGRNGRKRGEGREKGEKKGRKEERETASTR